MGGRDHAAEPVIVLRVKTIGGSTRYVRADDLDAARQQELPNVPTCNDQGVREAELHPGRPVFLYRVRVANIVQADALPPIRAEVEPVQAAAPRAATTAAGLVLDAEEEEQGYSASL